MSLLMDALRKAEDAKRQAVGSAVPPTAAAEMTLEPLGAPASVPTTRLPDLAEHSAALDAGLSAVAHEARARANGSAPRPRPPAGQDQDDSAARAAARNVFAAKTSAPARGKAWTIIGALGVAAALGIGAYFWWQLQALPGNARLQPMPPPVPVPAPSAATPAAPTAPALPASVPAPAAPLAMPLPAASSTPPPTTPARMEQSRAAQRASVAASTDAVPPASAAARQRAARAEDPRPGGSTDAALRVHRTRPGTPSVAEQSFDALQAGRLDDAQRGYEQLLRSDAQSTDALLGLATIAVRQGRHEQAQDYYLRALEADPTNATAQAGLINGRGYADAGVSESRLKGALDAQPESSALLFALGNLYARQARWSEAQQAYFRAYAAEPDNADILFNLAVALDHLRQARLAAQYYQMALDTARSAGNHTLFDRDQARARIQELQP